MKDNLRLYLFDRWKRNNHPKYLKYFEEWLNNLTNIQIYYFEIERQNILEKAKEKP